MIKAILSNGSILFEYFIDFIKSLKHSKSPIFISNSSREYEVILLAHTIEKGLSHPKIRYGFGLKNIRWMLDVIEKINFDKKCYALSMAYGCLIDYIDLHERVSYDLGEDAKRIEKFLKKCSDLGFGRMGGVIDINKNYPASKSLLLSRHSTRYFRDEIISDENLSKIINIARMAPSQCNRQSGVIFVCRNKEKIKKLLSLQGGAETFKDNVSNLFIIASDMRAWSGGGSRHQAHVDGALLGHQLALACCEHGVDSCFLNLAVTNKREDLIKNVAGISDNYRLVFMMAFGYSDRDAFKIPMSHRLSSESISFEI